MAGSLFLSRLGRAGDRSRSARDMISGVRYTLSTFTSLYGDRKDMGLLATMGAGSGRTIGDLI